MSSTVASLRQLIASAHPGQLAHADKDADGVVGDELGKPGGNAFFGVAKLDAMVRSGLCRSLHIVGADRASNFALASGFSLAALSRLDRDGTIVWVTQSLAGLEAGRLHGAGLVEMALDPARFLYVDAKRSSDVLWAVEESLSSRAVAAVVGEVFDEPAVTLTATRRIALRSERTKIPVHLLAPRADALTATAARTRWRIGPAPSREIGPHQDLLGEPLWQVELLKNRAGPCGGLVLGYSPARRAYFTPEPGRARSASTPSSAAPVPARRASMTSAVVRLAAERRLAAESARERQ